VEHKNFLQSPEFAEWRRLCGDDVVEVAGNFMVIKNAKRGRYAEIPGLVLSIRSARGSGPEELSEPTGENEAASTRNDGLDERRVRRTSSQADLKDQVELLCGSVREAAKACGCIFVRVRPQLLDSPENLAAFRAASFKPAPRHLYAENTIILNLTKTEDQLLADMRKQTRYEIKHLDRYPDLKIECISAIDNASIAAWEDFAALQADTARRQGFVPPSRSELLHLREAFWDKALLYRASAKTPSEAIKGSSGEDGALAYALVITSGDEADYFEAASSEAARDLPVAYALQWQIIRDIKSQGFKYYNLFGIAPAGESKHRYAKLTTFKRGFGGQVVNYLPAHDLPIDRFKYRLLHLYELIEKRRMQW